MSFSIPNVRGTPVSGPQSWSIANASMPPGMIMTQAGMQPQYQCINPGNPYSDVEVGMPDEEIDPAVCAKMGIPEGSKWGFNAAEVRELQSVAVYVRSLRGVDEVSEVVDVLAADFRLRGCDA